MLRATSDYEEDHLVPLGLGGAPYDRAQPNRIIIECLPKEQLRYDTLGDWFWDKEGNLIIQVAGGDPLDHDEAFLAARRDGQ